MKKIYLWGIALMGSWAFQACSNADEQAENWGGTNNDQIITLAVSNSNSSSTRARRPLLSSAADQTIENVVVCDELDRGLDSVVDLGQVFERSPKGFTDGLFAEADTEYAFIRGVPTDQRKQNTGLFGNSRSGREDDLVETFHLVECNPVVAVNFRGDSCLFEDMQ